MGTKAVPELKLDAGRDGDLATARFSQCYILRSEGTILMGLRAQASNTKDFGAGGKIELPHSGWRNRRRGTSFTMIGVPGISARSSSHGLLAQSCHCDQCLRLPRRSYNADQHLIRKPKRMQRSCRALHESDRCNTDKRRRNVRGFGEPHQRGSRGVLEACNSDFPNLGYHRNHRQLRKRIVFLELEWWTMEAPHCARLSGPRSTLKVVS